MKPNLSSATRQGPSGPAPSGALDDRRRAGHRDAVGDQPWEISLGIAPRPSVTRRVEVVKRPTTASCGPSHQVRSHTTWVPAADARRGLGTARRGRVNAGRARRRRRLRCLRAEARHRRSGWFATCATTRHTTCRAASADARARPARRRSAVRRTSRRPMVAHARRHVTTETGEDLLETR
jgi:hypothetical protein